MKQQIVEHYMHALADPEQFGHTNEQTIRSYIDVLIFVLFWGWGVWVWTNQVNQ